MRTALTLAAFAAGALAMPYKRELVTDIDMFYVTEVVTVTAGQAQATAAAYSAPGPINKDSGYNGDGKNNWWDHKPHQPAAYSSPAPAPAPEPTTTTFQAPVYTPTSTPTPTPTPESTTEYQTPPPAPETSAYVEPTTSESSAPPPSYESPEASSPPNYSSPYQKTVVEQHNIHRANHSASPLEWDEQLASTAAKIAASCKYAHNTMMDRASEDDPYKYGQNIAAGVEADKVGEIITNMFYNGEEPLYANLYGNPLGDGIDIMSIGFEQWGHFSQMVWKDTNKVGCATQHCPGGLFDDKGNPMSDLISPYFTVCNYQNPGNVAGGYAENIGRPLGHPTVQG